MCDWAQSKRELSTGGGRIAFVEVESEGQPLLLLHGFTDTARSFSLLAPHLAGRRLVMPDLPGHGGSPGNAGTWRFSGCADAVARLIAELGLERPVVVGHSLGAMVALDIAARQPDLVGGLVLIAGAVRPSIAPHHPMAIGVRALRDPIAPDDPFYAYWHACRPDVPRGFLDRIAEEASAMPSALWRAILDQIAEADLTMQARAVRARTLLVAGGCDPLFGEAHQHALRKAMPAAIFRSIEGCGHNPHWEEPALVAAAIASAFPPETRKSNGPRAAF